MKNFTFLTNKTWGVVFALALTFVSVKLSAQFQINLDLQHPTSEGYTNGQAEVNPTGGLAPYSYEWSSGHINHIAWSLTAGDYAVTVTDANGQAVSENFTLVVGGSGASNLQALVTIQDISCNNYNDGAAMASVTGGQPPYSFNWSTGSTDEYISSLTNGDYSVTVTDATGATSVAAGSVVEPIATKVTIVKSQECGLPVDVTVTVTEGVGPFTFMWMKNGVLLQADEVTIGGSSTFTATEQTVYYLCTMNADGCPHDNWVPVAAGFELKEINVVEPACDGDKGSIDIAPTSINGPATYHWEGPNGFTADTEDITGLSPGTYTCVATDAGGCTATYTKTITDQGAMTADFSYTLKSCENNEMQVDFSAITGNVGVTSYAWSFGDNASSPSHTFSSNPENVVLDIVYDNGCTASITKPVNLEVVSANVPASAKACVGEEFQVNVGDNNGNITSWSWSPASLIQSGGNTANPVLNTTTSGNSTLQVEMTSDAGCTVIETIELAINDGTAMTVDEGLLSNRQCDGQTIDFGNTNNNAGDFHWAFPDGTTSSDVNASFDFSSYGAGTQTVLLVPDNNECASSVPYEVDVKEPAEANFDFKLVGCLDSVILTDMSSAPSPITGWSWDIAGTEFKEQNPKIPADLINSEDFSAKLTIEFGDGCSLTFEKMIQVTAIETNVPPTALICEEGGSVSLNPGGDTGYQYTWSPATGLDDPNSPNPMASPSVTQIYTVDIVDVNGTESCMVTQEVEVTVAPISLQTSEDTVLCDDAAMAPLMASHDGDDFAWYDNPNLTGTPVSTALNFMAGPGTYYAVTTNDAGCKEVQEIQISANPISTGLVQDEFTLCGDDAATLEVVSPASTDLIEWYNGNELIGTGNPFPLDSSVSGDYTVVVTNVDGCTATEMATIDVIDINVETSVDPVEIYRGQTADLGADDGFMSYVWTPDDGSVDNPNTANPVITPQETTTYTLVVTDDNGCTTSSSVTITVKETECGEPYIYLPNAFTPNGDGNGNDVLYLRGLNLSNIQLSIYNRWGQLVFETYDQSIGWDGTFNGEPVVPDVYGFYLRVTCDNGEKYFKKGNITVLK